MSIAMLLGAVIGSGAISGVSAEDNVLRSTPNYPFEIVECTKLHQMGVGQPSDDKNVLRKKKTTPKFVGAWYLVDADKLGNSHIVHKKTGKYLDVQSVTGNVHIATARKNDNEQKFRIEKLTMEQAKKVLPKAIFDKARGLDSFGVTFVRIREFTRNERLRVSDNGNIERWSRENNKNQIFVIWRPTA